MNALAFILLRQSVLRRQSLAETRPSCDDAPPSKRLPDAGVTLIEMMVVLVIIGIVAVAKADLRTVAASLEMYKLDNRTYPTTEQGLAALTAPPTSQPIPLNWVQGGYLPTPPVDPWGNSYLYKSPADNGPYELISNGADGVPGGDGADADIRHGPGIAGTGDGTANG
jgi:general secretion pathway protein G